MPPKKLDGFTYTQQMYDPAEVFQRLQMQSQPMQPQEEEQKQEKKRSFLMSLLPMATGTLGAVGGGLVGSVLPGAGTAIGAAGGGAAGGAVGEWLAQQLSGEAKDGIDKGNLLEEGAWGALPGVGKGLKYARGAAKAGKAINTADDVADVSKAAGAGGLKDKIGKFLFRQADDTALRATQMSGKKEALKGFEKRFGEDFGTYIRKNNLIGKTGKDVESGLIKNLSDDYGKLVGNIDRPITSSDVLAQNQKQLQKLLDSSSTDKKKLGQQVFDELSQIFSKGDSIDPADFNRIKGEYQTLSRNAYKLGADPARTGVNKEVASILKKTLQGVSGSDDLARTGTELDKAFKASDLLASAAQNGRGTLSLGLTDLLAGGVGAGVGNVPGAIAAVGAKKAYNSPKVQSYLASKLGQAGERVLSGGAKKATQETGKATAKSLAREQVPTRALQSLVALNSAGGGAQPGQDGMQYGADGAGAQQQPQDIQSLMAAAQPVSQSPYSRENMMADVQRDPKNAKEYMALYEMLNPEPEALSLSDGAIGRITDAQKALGGLDELEQIINNDFAGGAVQGRLRSINPFDETFQTQQASINRVKQIVGKALEGGVLRKEDEEKYAKILPTMNDRPEVARSKIMQLRNMIAEDMQRYTSTQSAYGKGAGQSYDLQSILGAGGATY